MKNIYIKIVFVLVLIFTINKVNATEYPELLKSNCIDCLELENLNNSEDQSMDIENWMVNDSFWNIEDVNNLNDFIVSDEEYSEGIEEWMMSISVKSTEEGDKSVENDIEAWMLDSKFLEIQAEENRNVIELKTWMFDADFWTI